MLSTSSPQNWILDGSNHHTVKSENGVFNLIRDFFDESTLVIHDMVSVKPSTSSLQVLIRGLPAQTGSTDTYFGNVLPLSRLYCRNAIANLGCQSLLDDGHFHKFHRLTMHVNSNSPCKSRNTAFDTHRRHRLLIAKWKIKKYLKMHAGLLLNSNIRRILQGPPEPMTSTTMPSTKRQSDSDSEGSLSKTLETGKQHKPTPMKVYNRIASLDNATAANKNPPVAQLQNALKSIKTPDTVDTGACVVYWMRMEDLRSTSSSIARFSFLIVVTKSATTAPSLMLPISPSLIIFLSLCYLCSVLRTTKPIVEERDELISHSAIWCSSKSN